MTRKKKNVKASYIAENIDKIPYIPPLNDMPRAVFIRLARVWFGACRNTADKAYYMYWFLHEYDNINLNEIAKRYFIKKEDK